MARLSATTGVGWNASELVVERHDLRPVGVGGGWRVGVDGLDGRLDLVRPGLVAAQAGANDGVPLGDEIAVPGASILVGEADEVAGGVARAGRRAWASSINASSPSASGSSGMSDTKQPREPDRLAAEVVAGEPPARRRDVPLVEHEVDHREHRAQPVRQLGVVGDAVGDVGGADLVLRADEPLRHRRLGHEERPGDLAGLEPPDEAERQGHLGARSRGRGGST